MLRSGWKIFFLSADVTEPETSTPKEDKPQYISDTPKPTKRQRLSYTAQREELAKKQVENVSSMQESMRVLVPAFVTFLESATKALDAFTKSVQQQQNVIPNSSQQTILFVDENNVIQENVQNNWIILFSNVY